MWNSLFLFLINSACRTGRDENSPDRATVVPLSRAVGVVVNSCPEESYSRRNPVLEEVHRVRMVKLEQMEAREERASPRNPNVSTELKSSNSTNLEVWCFKAG